MSDFNNQWIEIFRAGEYGEKGSWPAERLQQVVRNFDPATWRAPAVLGHPKDDSPAFGWVAEVKEEEGRLLVRLQDVHPALETLVADGRYPNRSAAFYVDPQGNGPVLRHVGFLGARPPEVKGLGPLHFSDQEFVAIELTGHRHPAASSVADGNHTPGAEQMRKTVLGVMREFFADTFGRRGQVRVFTEEEVRERVAQAIEPMREKLDELAGEFRRAQEEAHRQDEAVIRREQRSRVEAFIEKQRARNRWVPAFDRAGLPQVLNHLAASGGTIEFSEGGKTSEVSPYDLLVGFLEQIPHIMPTRELAKAARRAGRLIPFTEPHRGSGASVDPYSITLAERVEALKPEVRKEHPQADLTRVHTLALERARREGGATLAVSAGKV